ncbi:unnamed protein product [Medioppia subpectinata]|uniref:Spaetzle domain-containing protein n=1 Tax=Medioppia subpectinata TaxID=1979941 RepID=A0A7R9KN25_9ACAR|nr:unnamed protein product [Medioppia subpectinata]CAG2105585.1 unnamed protein product [Medioppia subpectinata]
MIILLGLQIFRVANQLMNGSTPLHPFPANSDDISKRYNELKTLDDSSDPKPSIRKYSKQKIIPKPHSYAESVKRPKYRNNYLISDSDVNSDDKNESDFDSQPNAEVKDDDNNSDDNNNNKYVADYNELEQDFNDFDTNDESDDKNEEPIEESADYNYKEEMTPECASEHTFCDYDDNYPQNWIQKSIDKQMDLLTQIMPESSETFDLVEGISKERDENYTYSENVNHMLNDDQNDDKNTDNNEIQYTNGGYICPSLVDYIQPKRAQNTEGLWKVILNLNESYRGIDVKQHIRLEECHTAMSGCWPGLQTKAFIWIFFGSQSPVPLNNSIEHAMPSRRQ